MIIIQYFVFILHTVKKRNFSSPRGVDKIKYCISLLNLSGRQWFMMTGDRFNYYLKLVINANMDDYSQLLDFIGNDELLSESEQFELANLIKRSMSSLNSRYNLRVINTSTGLEESPPITIADDFRETSVFEGYEQKYGITWSVYSPNIKYSESPVKKWLYNQRVMTILGDLLGESINGKSQDYFHTPPWIMGKGNASGMKYQPLQDIINNAIANRFLPSWEYLIIRGIPSEFVNAMREASPDFPQ